MDTAATAVGTLCQRASNAYACKPRLPRFSARLQTAPTDARLQTAPTEIELRKSC